MRHQPTRKPKLTANEFAARFKAERERQQQRFCDAFALWRRCANKRCRRHRACRGDAGACLQHALELLPHAAQWQARQDILTATPNNIGAPERAARLCMPRDFYRETAGEAAAEYLARFAAKRTAPSR